jgi:ATP phosphoribosyltransferase
MIRLGLPKGRMAPESDRFCNALGVKVRPGVLSYRTTAKGLDIAVFLVKAPDVARLLRRNLLDLGLTGDEWLMESGSGPDCRCFEARSYMASICLLMAEGDPRPSWSIQSVVTPYPNLARRLLGKIAPGSEVMAVNGSTEALVPGIADAGLDVVETGTSAALNSLVVRESFDQVTTHLVRSEACDPFTVAPIVELLAEGQGLVRWR